CFPICLRKWTSIDGTGMSALCRFCSLIPGFGVKLSAIILAGPTVLSAVGACPPHDGVRRRWWINVASAVSLIESSQKIRRSHHRYRPGRDIFSHCAAGLRDEDSIAEICRREGIVSACQQTQRYGEALSRNSGA